eukprot:TRINITY_DN75162_c0_g1_i1.p1 TRINITY_DN75162_c0_g1~~TRINITY_DN75162_c0_g1_i1.p1  ORF type:complete len:184 (+),score=34.26 TRINITY_DN75162_c0_g1_i1:72-623(+)
MPPPLAAPPPGCGEFKPPAITGEVILTGLPEERRLNGERGTAVKTISDGRTVVRLRDGRELAFESESLKQVATNGGGHAPAGPVVLNGHHKAEGWATLMADVSRRCSLDKLARIQTGIKEFHEICRQDGEDAARMLLDVALGGNDEATRCFGVESVEEVRLVSLRVEADLRMLALERDDADLR